MALSDELLAPEKRDRLARSSSAGRLELVFRSGGFWGCLQPQTLQSCSTVDVTAGTEVSLSNFTTLVTKGEVIVRTSAL